MSQSSTWLNIERRARKRKADVGIAMELFWAAHGGPHRAVDRGGLGGRSSAGGGTQHQRAIHSVGQEDKSRWERPGFGNWRRRCDAPPWCARRRFERTCFAPLLALREASECATGPIAGDVGGALGCGRMAALRIFVRGRCVAGTKNGNREAPVREWAPDHASTEPKHLGSAPCVVGSGPPHNFLHTSGGSPEVL